MKRLHVYIGTKFKIKTRRVGLITRSNELVGFIWTKIRSIFIEVLGYSMYVIATCSNTVNMRNHEHNNTVINFNFLALCTNHWLIPAHLWLYCFLIPHLYTSDSNNLFLPYLKHLVCVRMSYIAYIANEVIASSQSFLYMSIYGPSKFFNGFTNDLLLIFAAAILIHFLFRYYTFPSYLLTSDVPVPNLQFFMQPSITHFCITTIYCMYCVLYIFRTIILGQRWRLQILDYTGP